MDSCIEKIHPSWKNFFEKEHDFLEHVASEIKNDDYTPDRHNIFKFAELPIHNIKCAVIGQDPYPAEGAATGLAFEVGTLHCWTEPFRQSSLRNILRAVYKAYSGEIVTWSELRQKIANGEFDILPPNQLFKNWANQGVLLLNTSLTCRIGEPNSHKALWQGFCGRVIDFVNSQNCNILWFLWGKEAWEYGTELNPGNTYISRHPMLAGTGHPLDFLNCKCFAETKNIINWTGEKQTSGGNRN